MEPNQETPPVNQPTTPITPPNVNPENKPKKSHKILFLIIGLLIIILTSGIGGIYYLNKDSALKSTPAQNTSKEIKINKTDTSYPSLTQSPKEPAIKKLENGTTFYQDYKYKFSLILPKGFSIKSLPHRTEGIGYHEISNGTETYHLLDSLGGGPPFEPKPIDFEIYGGKVARIDEGNFAGCSSDCYTILAHERDAIFDPQTEIYSKENLKFILMNYTDERTNSDYSHVYGKTDQDKIIYDIRSIFPEYDTINIVSIIGDKTGLGVAGNKNKIGGIYFWFEKNNNGVWKVKWQGKEFPMCQERFHGQEYKCPWDS